MGNRETNVVFQENRIVLGFILGAERIKTNETG